MSSPSRAPRTTGFASSRRAGTYLPANSPDTQGAWKRCSASSPEHPRTARAGISRVSASTGDTLKIEDRVIPFIRESGGVVWFDFPALCSGPRSQDDYIEIARNYQSVILSGVPVSSRSHEDEARRFIAVVDEFYDRNVNPTRGRGPPHPPSSTAASGWDFSSSARSAG